MSANPTWKGKLRAACMVLSNAPVSENIAEMLGTDIKALGISDGPLLSEESSARLRTHLEQQAATVLYEVILGVCDANPAISIAIAKRLEQMSPGGQGIDLFAEASTEEKLFVPETEEVPPLLAELKLQTELLRRLARAVSPAGDALNTRISE